MAQGGWRWLSKQQLLLFLGPPPAAVEAEVAEGPASWSLQLRPRQLQAKGLLPSLLPLVVRRAAQLEISGEHPSGVDGQMALSGELKL